jgi:PQQ-dependent dehydrogenase (methanol/ethanol family)
MQRKTPTTITRFAVFLTVYWLLTGCENRPPEVANVDRERLSAADTAEAGHWLSHGRGWAEKRFSPLAEVTAKTVSRLGLTWVLELPTKRGIEATPIVVDGRMFVTGGWSTVYAIDAQTGELLWSYDPEVPRDWAAYACCDVVNRGVAVWHGKVFFATLDGRLIALDAATGKKRWAMQTTDKRFPYTITGAPRVVNGKVIIGNSGADFGVRGYISAYNPENGRRFWRFFTVPGDPSKGFDHDGEAAMERAAQTWTGEWWKTGGGGTVWNSMAFDPEINLLYIGVGNGTPWSQQQRSPAGGDNLFLSSIVALDADSGEYVWHYQTTPGESWNYSAAESIILAELEINGRLRKVLMQAPKNGFFYVLDRKSGELLSAEPYAAVNWASHIDLQSGRPVEYPHARYGTEGRLIMPGPSGGHSWYPMSFSPITGLAYIPAQDVPGIYKLDKDFRFEPGYQNTGITEGITNFDALDPQGNRPKVRFGVYLIAWDPVKQAAAWKLSQDELGGGTLVTAGNLVFQGSSSGHFRAYQADAGAELWSFDAGTSIMAGPVTYTVDGEQYVAVMAGRGGGAGLLGGPMARAWQGVKNVNRVLAFKLEGNATLPRPERYVPASDPPPSGAGAAVIARGKELYETYCYVCHGLGVEGGGVLPDLRYANHSVHEAWVDIVIGGALKDRGMRSWSEVIDTDDARAIQAYVIQQAQKISADGS